MTRHKPSKPMYGVLGADVSTEITFELPSVRFENITGTLFGRKIQVVGLTTCTPRDADTTQVTQIFYWPAWLGFIKPFFLALGPTFLGDDRRMVERMFAAYVSMNSAANIDAFASLIFRCPAATRRLVIKRASSNATGEMQLSSKSTRSK